MKIEALPSPPRALLNPVPTPGTARAQYGKDYFYRAHPEDLKKFYAAVDEFHRVYAVVTEFDSLNGLAADLLPGEEARGWGRGGVGWPGEWRGGVGQRG
jgi:hypothetical protein